MSTLSPWFAEYYPSANRIERMSKEDEMTSALIGVSEPQDDSLIDNVERTIHPEAHYNHYGTRGVVDLYVRNQSFADGQIMNEADLIYEVKADAAVREATGANQIIRQFNKHREYFYKDDSTRKPSDLHFELVFVPSELTIRHVIDNYELYKAASKREFHDGEWMSSMILFRTPNREDDTPIHPMTKTNDFSDPIEMLEKGFPNEDSHCGREVRKYLESIYNS